MLVRFYSSKRYWVSRFSCQNSKQKSRVKNNIIQKYPKLKFVFIYLMWNKSKRDSCPSLKYNFVWNFLYSPCRLSWYFQVISRYYRGKRCTFLRTSPQLRWRWGLQHSFSLPCCFFFLLTMLSWLSGGVSLPIPIPDLVPGVFHEGFKPHLLEVSS